MTDKQALVNLSRALGFDLQAHLEAIDEREEKHYDMPAQGARMMQVHGRGQMLRVVVGRVEGLEVSTDAKGRVAHWRAHIVTGTGQARTIDAASTWRSPASWHPMPAHLQDDHAFRIAIETRLEAVEHEVAQIKKELATFADAEGVEAVMGEVIERVQLVEETLTNIERMKASARAPDGETIVAEAAPALSAPPPPEPAQRRGKGRSRKAKT